MKESKIEMWCDIIVVTQPKRKLDALHETAVDPYRYNVIKTTQYINGNVEII